MAVEVGREVLDSLRTDRVRMKEATLNSALLTLGGVALVEVGSAMESIGESRPLIRKLGAFFRVSGTGMTGLGVFLTGLSLVSINDIRDKTKRVKSGDFEHFEP